MRTPKILPLLLSWACAVEPELESEPATFPEGTQTVQTEDPTDPGTDPVVTSPERAEIGKRALDFTLEAADGGFVQLSDYEGQVIVLDLSGFT